jgi:transposase
MFLKMMLFPLIIGPFDNRKTSRDTLIQRMKRVQNETRKLLKRGRRSTSRRAKGFCRELLRMEPALWTFTTIDGIEPANNHAERMLRPAVMWRKQSLGSHSLKGCRFVECMLTVLQTLKLRNKSVMNYLETAIHALRCGVSPPPLPA